MFLKKIQQFLGQTEPKDELKKALGEYTELINYFDNFPSKLHYTFEHLKVFLNKRYSAVKDLLQIVNKRLGDYETRLKKLENKVVKNTTIKQIMIDMDR